MNQAETASAPDTLLEMRHISKAFGGTQVLSDVQFELRAGEVHVLAGENGAGKSTLMKILGGVHADYQGQITVAGRSVHFRSPHQAAAHGIAIIHQELSLVPAMSVSDNIFLGRELLRHGGVASRAQEERTGHLLSQFGLAIDVKAPVDAYPLSVQQLVEIAKALAAEARIIVMDEPTSALTDPEAEKLFATVAQLKARGCGIVYISHKMQEIYRLADRITVLRDGRYIGTAPAAELPPAELIRRLVGREMSQQFPPPAAAPGPERLRVEDLWIGDPARPGHHHVAGVSFSARQGEILGLAGLQGSGSSELLSGLFGALGRPAAGRVLLDGAPLHVHSPRQAVQHGLALLTNDRKGSGLVLSMSVRQNLTLAALSRFSPGGWLRRRLELRAAQARTADLGIRCASTDQQVAFLSGGNQQKVVLAKWMETQPRVLLLDEPTRGVDVGAKHEIYQLMNQWRAAGCTILLITSEMPELLAMADRVLVMHRGRITAEFPRHQATQENILRAAMGDDAESANRNGSPASPN